MNILVLTPWFPNQPNEQEGSFILDSIKSLVAIGHNVHVLVTRPFRPNFTVGEKQRSGAAIGVEMHQLGFTLSGVQYLSIPRNHLRFVSNRLYKLGCAGAVKRAVAAHHIDVIHAHTESAGCVACEVVKGTGVAVVTSLHGINLGMRYLDGLGQPGFMRRAFSCPDRLVLVGQPLFDFVKLYIDRLDHVRVVHNGFRVSGAEPFRKRRVLSSPDRVQIASVSNLVDGKGIDINLAALGRPEILGLSNWHYHIVGDGPLLPALEAQARQLNISHRVTFHGKYDHDKVFPLLATCDVFSLPSSPEAFGVAYLEAMACGLLAIGVQSQGPSYFIDHEQSGVLIREQSVDHLAASLLEILKSPSRYAAMAEAGRERVWQHFTWNAHGAALTRVLDEVVAQRAELAYGTLDKQAR